MRDTIFSAMTSFWENGLHFLIPLTFFLILGSILTNDLHAGLGAIARLLIF